MQFMPMGVVASWGEQQTTRAVYKVILNAVFIIGVKGAALSGGHFSAIDIFG